jgi:DNA-binding response OmpR family regulator
MAITGGTAQATASPTHAAGATVLLVEDDPSLRLVTRLACESAGLVVQEAATGSAALAAAHAARPDVVLLDLMLPDLDGFDVCRALRARDAALPIIMLTARGEETDKVVGLELGADDYLTKPFSTRELLARIRAQLRKAHLIGAPAPASAAGAIGGAAHDQEAAARGAVLHIGELHIDSEAREVVVGSSPVTLTRTEFDILLYLSRNAGKALARAQIIEAVWGYDSNGDDRLVDSHIKNLRRKLESRGMDGALIATVPQIGYKLVRPAA